MKPTPEKPTAPAGSLPRMVRRVCNACLGCGRLRGRGIYVRGVVVPCPKCNGTGRSSNAERSDGCTKGPQ